VVGIALGLAAASTVAMAVYATADDLPYGAGTSRVYFGSDTHSMGLFLGSAAGAWWALRRYRSPVRARASASLVRVTDVVGIVAVGIVAYQFLHLNEFSPMLYRGGFLVFDAVVLAAIMCAVRSGSFFGRLLDMRPVRWVGQRVVLDLHLALASGGGDPSGSGYPGSGLSCRSCAVRAHPDVVGAVVPVLRTAATHRSVRALEGVASHADGAAGRHRRGVDDGISSSGARAGGESGCRDVPIVVAGSCSGDDASGAVGHARFSGSACIGVVRAVGLALVRNASVLAFVCVTSGFRAGVACVVYVASNQCVR
jgi:hypothetical protein